MITEHILKASKTVASQREADNLSLEWVDEAKRISLNLSEVKYAIELYAFFKGGDMFTNVAMAVLPGICTALCVYSEAKRLEAEAAT